MAEIVLESLKLTVLACALAVFWGLAVYQIRKFFKPSEHSRLVNELLKEAHRNGKMEG